MTTPSRPSTNSVASFPPGKDVYEKYRNLRTTFFREHKRVTRPVNETGTSNGQPYVSRWRHYQCMQFLTKTQSSSSTLDNNSSTGSLVNDDSGSLPNGHDMELDSSTGGANQSNIEQSEVVFLTESLPFNGTRKFFAALSDCNQPFAFTAQWPSTAYRASSHR